MFKLSPEEISKIRHLYEERLKKFGHNPKSVGWGSTEDQLLRFKVLSEIGDLKNTSIIDIGCGLGDLYKFLKGCFDNISYLGIDISPKLIEKAREIYEAEGAEFLHVDILDDSFKREADYFLLSGALNFRVKDNLLLAKNVIKKMFLLARRGVACNFLSRYVDYETEKNFHYSPEEIFSISKKISKYLTIRHDYPLWEFTVYLYKR